MTEFKLNANEYSPLVLAYLGDAVYELYVRSRLMEYANLPVNTLFVKSTAYVKAEAQFHAYHFVLDRLSEEELAVLKRGRNAKSATVPKNADVTHYRCATGVEALMGYLYIKGRHDRIEELMGFIFDGLSNK
ncbi:MAG: Mini-ribonuclease 3 [Clostridia bacterium]|nr:Mini-ribonuclease 3 [Clostridia bacterium]